MTKGVTQRQELGHRLASRRWPGSAFPLSALAVAMDVDDHGVGQAWVVRDSRKEPCEDITLDPVADASEGGGPVANDRGRVAPWDTGPGHPPHCLHEPSQVTDSPAGRFAQAAGLDPGPLRIAQTPSCQWGTSWVLER